MSPIAIPKENARLFRIARVVLGVAFVGFIVAAALRSTSSVLAFFVVAGLSALISYAWRCPNCGKTFALKLGFIGIAMPYTNTCLHCGSRLQ